MLYRSFLVLSNGVIEHVWVYTNARQDLENGKGNTAVALEEAVRQLSERLVGMIAARRNSRGSGPLVPLTAKSGAREEKHEPPKSSGTAKKCPHTDALPAPRAY